MYLDGERLPRFTRFQWCQTKFRRTKNYLSAEDGAFTSGSAGGVKVFAVLKMDIFTYILVQR